MFKSINGGKLPQRATRFSAGFDVFANEDAVIGAGETKLVGIGLAIDYDAWHEFLVFGKGRGLFKNFHEFMLSHYLALHIRSSLRAKGLTSLGTGVIDIDFIDEIKMVIHNPYQNKKTYWRDTWEEINTDYKIKKGDKIGQLILCRHEGYLMPAEYTLDSTRTGGFGSTN